MLTVISTNIGEIIKFEVPGSMHVLYLLTPAFICFFTNSAAAFTESSLVKSIITARSDDPSFSVLASLSTDFAPSTLLFDFSEGIFYEIV